MADIDLRTVSEANGWQFEITVSDGGSSTRHTVTVSREDYDRLTAGRATAEDLVRESFRFLLEREPKESILREFDITAISRYFPEYEREIGGRLSG